MIEGQDWYESKDRRERDPTRSAKGCATEDGKRGGGRGGLSSHFSILAWASKSEGNIDNAASNLNMI